MAGNGTIGLEILEDLPEVDAILVPYGGGGLSCGIASAVRALRPATRVHPVEVETAAPLAASWAAGRPITIPYISSFVDGIGSPRLFPGMWEVARAMLDVPLVVSLEEVAEAIRVLVRRLRITAEGAGAAAPAAAMSGRAGAGAIACIVSGGSIDAGVLARVLQGDLP
jgi:threonine dehydratase